jgi:CRP/FNR family transcriptional regulator, anaerobic regulatory protein
MPATAVTKPLANADDLAKSRKSIQITPIKKEAIKVACSSCNLRELCMPVGLNQLELDKVDELVAQRRIVKRGTSLFHTGEHFTSLYAIRSGFFKTCLTTEDGRDQVTGFQMAGEIIGLDGIVNDRHTCDALALEDSEVCVMPFDQIENISREVNALQHHVHKIMSREIVRENSVMLLLGSMRAEERVAAFLLNLVQRLEARGFSKSDFVLRMTREEIGSFLGMKIETVSRTFSKFADEGLISVNQRNIHIKDADALRRLVSPHTCE